MAVTIPSLTTAGWIKNLPDRADRALAYFIASEHSQDSLNTGVTSLTKLVQMHGNQPTNLRSATEVALREYFGRLFESSDVIVRTDIPDPGSSEAMINLTIDVTVTEGGVTHKLSSLIKTTNSTLTEIVKLTND